MCLCNFCLHPEYNEGKWIFVCEPLCVEALALANFQRDAILYLR